MSNLFIEYRFIKTTQIYDQQFFIYVILMSREKRLALFRLAN